MNMAILITKRGLDKLTSELNHLLKVERPSACQYVEDTRPIGVVEDNPEYMQAIDIQDRVERRISELSNIIADCSLFNPQLCNQSVVSFGATVELVNEDTSERKTYTIVSIYESDVPNGFISIECPLVRAMIGYRIGEEFEFNDNYYVINNITYSL